MESIYTQIFKTDYNRTSFEDNVLIPIFKKSVSNFQLYDSGAEQEMPLSETEKKTAKQILKFGEMTTADNRKIDLYEITLTDLKKVQIARVGLGALVKKLIIGNNAVFALFKYDNIKNKHWRFSFIAYDSFFENGQVQTKETNPKRYTYVFGDPYETYRTAIDRFQELDNKFQIEITDIQNAFAVEAMSDEFFKEYREVHYANFVKYLTGEVWVKKGGKYIPQQVQNPSNHLISVFNNNKKDARDFVKKLLGQIVFLYFLQKKGWLGAKTENYKDDTGDKNFIQNFYIQAGQNDSFYPLWLSKLFYETLNKKRDNDAFKMPDGEIVKIPYLNGGLFEKESNKYDFLTFPAELFTNLFEFFNRYNFTIYENSPEEHTIAVDPEMLGHIFENLLEDNKDKGAFYTPKEIVQYMTQESLIEYLTTHIGDRHKQDISDFVKHKNKKTLNDIEIKKIDHLLDSVKICDPAIGSGAFPMGLLQEIFSLKEHIAFDLGFKVWSPATVKENIIQNSIYGVDIEKGAVDIARLRFWLSLIVDEDEPKPLPNLAYKIVVGNSLVSKFGDEIIEIDWEIAEGTQHDLFGNPHQEKLQNLLKEISKKQKDYFTADNIQKHKLAKQIRLLKLDILSSQLLLMISTKGFEKTGDKRLTKTQTQRWLETKGWKNTLKQINALKTNNKPFKHFDWRLDFPEILNPIVTDNTGFDIVIGNPPYIKEYTQKSAFDGFRKSKYYQGKMDLWYGFACVSLDLLKTEGVECFIAQNNWVTSAGASIFRNKVLTETQIKLFTDFWNYKVFKTAGIQTMIYLLKKSLPTKKYSLKYSLMNNDTVKEHELVNFLNFNNENAIGEKYILNFESSLYKDKLITFNHPSIDKVLNEILDNEIDYLKDDEVANGIHTHHESVNKKMKNKLGGGAKIGDGIFGLSDVELKQLNLSKKESSLIKRFYSDTNSFRKYYGIKRETQFIIYTDSSFKKPNSLNDFPKLKRHLDKYQTVITSDNKPYGLHRARKEDFFLNEKIAVQRKCPSKPVFTYLDFESYLSAAFYIIKSKRYNLKYLTTLLNSKLIAFWLRYKGKMQGNNYQIDKEPLLEIPILQPKNVSSFTILLDYLLHLYNKENKDILTHTKNERIASHIEDILDMMVYELYFESHMKENSLDVLQFINPTPIENIEDKDRIATIIKDFYLWYQKQENAVRQRIMLLETRSKDTLAIIHNN